MLLQNYYIITSNTDRLEKCIGLLKKHNYRVPESDSLPKIPYGFLILAFEQKAIPFYFNTQALKCFNCRCLSYWELEHNRAI